MTTARALDRTASGKVKSGRGLRCLGCGGSSFYTRYTRRHIGRIVRSKVCRTCGRRHLTVEKMLR